MESLKAANGLKDTKATPFVTGMLHKSARVWKLAKGPPSMDMARSWLKENPSASRSDGKFKTDLKKASQLEGPTQKNNFSTWFNMMPKKQVAVRFSAPGKHSKAAPARGQYKIDQFYQSNHCLICNGLTANDVLRLCESCKTNHTQNTIANLYGRLSEIERKRNSLQSICRSCSMQPAGMNLPDAKCISIECPVMFVRAQAGQGCCAIRPVLMEALEEVKDA
ncbi:DNA polymerase zeta [Podochytrium sp. JEL0797]|nr:DNA polymerase zeta [Podochytrium sp. JEL0797]